MKLNIFILIAITSVSCSQTSNTRSLMESRYFTKEDFHANFNEEIAKSKHLYDDMRKSGMQDYQLCNFDFDFHSDSKEKLDSLSQFLTNYYSYKMNEVEFVDGRFELWGDAIEFPVDQENLLYWAINLYVIGYEFDCKLRGYGSTVDTAKFPDLSPSKTDEYFNLAMNAFEKQDYGLAIINWSNVLKIDSLDPNSLYSRACAKEKLYMWQSAFKDYNRALEIIPNFEDALVNRGALFDESGEYQAAINDYDKAIQQNSSCTNAFLNRGNTKFRLDDKEGACADWAKASELGDKTALERLEKHCR